MARSAETLVSAARFHNDPSRSVARRRDDRRRRRDRQAERDKGDAVMSASLLCRWLLKPKTP